MRIKKNPTIALLPLEVSAMQQGFLARLVEGKVERREYQKQNYVKISKRARPVNSVELDTSVVVVRSDSLFFSTEEVFPYVQGNRLKGFNPLDDRAFLVRRDAEWFAEIWFKPRTKPKIRKDQNKGNIPTPRIVSGGLPSLGKRR